MTAARTVLLLLSFVLPVALWPGSTSYESAKFLLWALAAAAWSALLGLAVARGRALAAPPRAFLAAGAALLLLMMAGLLRSFAPLLTVRALLWSALWWCAALVTAVTVRDRRDLRRVLWCACGGGATVCLYGLLQIVQVLPGPGEWGVPSGISTLGNENYVAELAATWLLPSLLLARGVRNRRSRSAASAIIVLLLTLLVASPAMGARVAALVAGGFALFGWLLARSRWSTRTPLFLGLLALAGAVVATALVSGVLTPDRDPENRSSWTARVFAGNHGAIRRTDWLVAREQWRASPLLGVGAGNYGVNWPRTRAALTADTGVAGLAEQAPVATRAHQEYLQLAAELGWAGVAWFAAVVAAGGLGLARRWRLATDEDARVSLLLLSSGMVAVAVTALVSFPAHLPASALALALLTGGLLSPATATATTRGSAWRSPRWAASLPLAVAFLLLFGAARAFHGDLLVARGSRLFVGGALDAAIEPLRAGVARLPWPGEGRLYLGLAQAAAGQADEAARTLEASLRDRPSFEAHLALAELHLDARRFERALALLDVVENCRPASTFRQQAGYLRALASLRQEHWDEATARFTALVAADAQDHRSWLGLGYLRALQGDLAGAAACYREAITALETMIAAPAPATAAARGQAVRWRAHLETAHQALASVAR